MAGDAATAAMVMRMDAGLDTGPVCLAEQVPIGPDDTAGQLHDRLSRQGAGLMLRALAALARGSLTATPQAAEGATYAAKITKPECRIDFSRAAQDVHNHVRGLAPFPGAWFEAAHLDRDIERIERIKVLRTEIVAAPAGALDKRPRWVLDDCGTILCGSGAIRLLEVQRAGKRPMSMVEFLRGFKLVPGTRLG